MIKNNDMLTLKDIAYDEINGTVNILYVLEGDEMVPFLVLMNDYQPDATILLRRDVLPTPLRYNDYSSYYEDSEIDLYLNSVYIKKLASVRQSVVPALIDITRSDSLGSAGGDTIQIQRNAFLLSYAEVGLSPSPTAAQEGKALEYFKNPSNRIAFSEGGSTQKPASWFLRTPNAYFESTVYSIGPNGEIGTGNANNENGIRPAICIRSDTKIESADFAENDNHAFMITL